MHRFLGNAYSLRKTHGFLGNAYRVRKTPGCHTYRLLPTNTPILPSSHFRKLSGEEPGSSVEWLPLRPSGPFLRSYRAAVLRMQCIPSAGSRECEQVRRRKPSPLPVFQAH